MIFDLEMIKAVYANLADRVENARKIVGKPLSLTEKILYSHVDPSVTLEAFKRGGIYKHLFIFIQPETRDSSFKT